MHQNRSLKLTDFLAILPFCHFLFRFSLNFTTIQFFCIGQWLQGYFFISTKNKFQQYYENQLFIERQSSNSLIKRNSAKSIKLQCNSINSCEYCREVLDVALHRVDNDTGMSKMLTKLNLLSLEKGWINL